MDSKSIKDLFKLRLSLTVVLSSLLCYGIGIKYGNDLDFSWIAFINLFLGGSLITFSSNTFNQILEQKQDSLMKRTQNRPLVKGTIKVTTALGIAIILALLGYVLLYIGNNALTANISIISLVLYSFVYTPSKKYTSFCVFIGAIPGALPPLIGYVAATGVIDLLGIYLFAFQFMWQFPHFWAIAWLLNEDYALAGYKMLPSSKGTSKISAYIICIYTIMTVIVALYPFFTSSSQLNVLNLYEVIVVLLLGIYFVLNSFRLLRNLDVASARRLMYASLIFMPLIYILIWI